MSDVNGAGTSPAEADSERMEIDRIKDLLRETVRGANGPFLGAGDAPIGAGRALLGKIRELVTGELAAVAKGEEDR